MPVTLTVRDETTSGEARASMTLEFPTERITVRELIRERVYQEVEDYNRRSDGAFRGLVQPAPKQASVDGSKEEPRRTIDWKEQYEKACEAFESMRVLVLVGDRQMGSLDETIELTRDVDVTFLKLVPLVGG